MFAVVDPAVNALHVDECLYQRINVAPKRSGSSWLKLLRTHSTAAAADALIAIH